MTRRICLPVPSTARPAGPPAHPPHRLLLQLLLLVLAAGAPALAAENDWFVPLGPPPKAAPRRISGGEGFPPLPLPATPLRRSERKKQPSAPALIGKVVWGEAASFTYQTGETTDISDWNLCPGDVQQVLEKARRVIGVAYGREEVDLASFNGDPQGLPVLFFSGVRTMAFSDAQVALLRSYVQRGGMMVFDSVAGSPYFTQSARELCRRAFPEEPLRQVPPDHPLFHMCFDLEQAKFVRNPPGQVPVLEAVYSGSRAGVVISPYGLGCGWDDHEVPLLKQAVAYDVDTASRLGVNLVAYAVGYGHVGLEEAKPEFFGALDQRRPANEFVFAQIRHEGHWDCHPGSAAALLAHLIADTSVQASRKRIALTPGKDDLGGVNLLFLTGLDEFHFGPEAQAALRGFIARGGTLVIDNALGLATFDQAVRREVAGLLPGARFQPLPPDHPLFSAAVPVREAHYTPAVVKLHPELKVPVFEGITVDGELRVIYTPFDLEAGWSSCEFPLARAYDGATATALGIDLVVYALTH